MTDVDTPDELRPLLFSIAYRMVGSVSEAEASSGQARARRALRDAPARAGVQALDQALTLDQLTVTAWREQLGGQ